MCVCAPFPSPSVPCLTVLGTYLPCCGYVCLLHTFLCASHGMPAHLPLPPCLTYPPPTLQPTWLPHAAVGLTACGFGTCLSMPTCLWKPHAGQGGGLPSRPPTLSLQSAFSLTTHPSALSPPQLTYLLPTYIGGGMGGVPITAAYNMNFQHKTCTCMHDMHMATTFV